MTEYFDSIHNQAVDGYPLVNPAARDEVFVPPLAASSAGELPASPVELAAQSYRVAGFWVRFWAFLMDLLVVTGLNAVIWNTWLPVSGKTGFIHALVNINSLFLGLTGAAYFILMTYYFQQTLGKMIVGIKIIQSDGQPLSWTTVVFRELVARSLSQLLGLYLGYIVCWFNSEKRCAHDFLSDTWVVYDNPGSATGYIKIQSGYTS